MAAVVWVPCGEVMVVDMEADFLEAAVECVVDTVVEGLSVVVWVVEVVAVVGEQVGIPTSPPVLTSTHPWAANEEIAAGISTRKADLRPTLLQIQTVAVGKRRCHQQMRPTRPPNKEELLARDILRVIHLRSREVGVNVVCLLVL